jgi:hypothetical protein
MGCLASLDEVFVVVGDGLVGLVNRRVFDIGFWTRRLYTNYPCVYTDSEHNITDLQCGIGGCETDVLLLLRDFVARESWPLGESLDLLMRAVSSAG